MQQSGVHRSSNTRVAVLTPPGRGAVATVLVQGAQARDIVSRRFMPLSRKRLTDCEVGSIVVGHFQGAEGASEELVVGLVAADRVEVHCHGGRAAVDAIVQSLTAEGATQCLWQEVTLASDADPIAAEALAALAEATTERTASILLDQYRGALRRAVERAIAQIEHGDLEDAKRSLDELLARAPVGLHLTRPWRIAIVGRPNVGKSSLINALLGYERAIVFDQPGTTRDVLTARTALDGWPVELADAAGLRSSDDPLETAGVQRATELARHSDLVLSVFEASAAWTAADDELLATTTFAKRLIVYNKLDLGTPARDARPTGIAVSAKTGKNLDELIGTIVQALVDKLLDRGAAVPFTQRQHSAIVEAAKDLTGGDSTAANEHLLSVISFRSPEPASM